VIILFGGNAPPTGSGNQAEDTWYWNIKTSTWNLTPAVPGTNIGRTYGACAFYKEKFVISLGDLKNDTTACHTNSAASGHLPTSATYYLNFKEKNSPNWDYEEAATERAPRLKRIAYTTFQKRLWVWGGFNFVCPCNINNGTAEWNTNLWSLDLENLHD